MPGHECGGHCDHGHEHDHGTEEEMGVQYSLYQKIDLAHVVCLNEATDGSGKTVFKPWNERMDRERYVESDVDAELLFNVPFSGNVKLKALVIIGGSGQSHPKRVRLFKNNPMTFDDIGAEPDQEFELTEDERGHVEYNLKPTKFSSVFHLSLHFPTNFGDGVCPTKVYYIGLKGDFLGEHKEGVVLATYEARPMPQDHKSSLRDEVGRHQVS